MNSIPAGHDVGGVVHLARLADTVYELAAQAEHPRLIDADPAVDTYFPAGQDVHNAHCQWPSRRMKVIDRQQNAHESSKVAPKNSIKRGADARTNYRPHKWGSGGAKKVIVQGKENRTVLQPMNIGIEVRH